MSEKFLEGKGSVITGAASGFGRGIAIEYAKRGAELCLVDINEELLEETTKLIEKETKQKVLPIICDVSKPDQVQAMAKQALGELVNVYVLHNNAGVAPNYGKDLLRLDEQRFDKIMEVNIKGQWLIGKAFGRKMKAQKIEPIAGKMIHTASIAGMNPDNKIPAYSISKAAVIAMMKLLAKSMAPKVTVNAISPGYHVTGIYLNQYDVMKMNMDEGHVKTPLNRIGTVEDVVNICSFLASPASDFITGHNFTIDGGIAEVGVPAWYIKTDI